METNQKKRWEKKGKQEPFGAVLEQGRVQVSLALTYPAPLLRRGWAGEKTTTLSTRVGELDGLFSTRCVTTDASRDATKTKRQCIRQEGRPLWTEESITPFQASPPSR